MALLRAREDSEPRPVTARASSGAPARAGRQLPIQNRRGSAGDHKDRTTAGRGSTQSHVIRLHEHSTTSRNVAIPTITIQALKQSRGNYVRHWWALGNTSETVRSYSADSSPHSVPQAPPHETPPHALRRRKPTAQATPHTLSGTNSAGQTAPHPRTPRSHHANAM